jgi:hypothetical protein
MIGDDGWLVQQVILGVMVKQLDRQRVETGFYLSQLLIDYSAAAT